MSSSVMFVAWDVSMVDVSKIDEGSGEADCGRADKLCDGCICVRPMCQSGPSCRAERGGGASTYLFVLNELVFRCLCCSACIDQVRLWLQRMRHLRTYQPLLGRRLRSRGKYTDPFHGGGRFERVGSFLLFCT